MHKALYVPPCDILVHCGDATNHGTLDSLQAFNAWCGDMKQRVCKDVIFVPGNHDKGLDPNRAENSEQFEKARIAMSNVILLTSDAVEVQGLRFYGASMTRTPSGRGAFSSSSENASFLEFSKIPEGLDVLVTHSPPYGVLDAVRRDFKDEHLGSHALREIVLTRRPKYHAFGHIHEGYGRMTESGIHFINASSCDSRKLPVNDAIEVLIELDPQSNPR